jgi:hypothetical protein
MRIRSTLAATATAAVALVLAASPALAADSSAAATTQTNNQAPASPVLVAVRSAHHPSFDRITFEFRGPRPSHRIGYVSQLVEDASGEPVHLAGRAAINVVFQGANAHDEQGHPTVSPRRFRPALPSLEEVAQIGDFEAVVAYGLGVDHKVPFKVLELSSPSRVAIDISTASSSGGIAAGDTGSSGTATSHGTGSASRGTLPLTGSQIPRLVLEGLGLLAVGLLVLTLARKTRTP